MLFNPSGTTHTPATFHHHLVRQADLTHSFRETYPVTATALNIPTTYKSVCAPTCGQQQNY